MAEEDKKRYAYEMAHYVPPSMQLGRPGSNLSHHHHNMAGSSSPSGSHASSSSSHNPGRISRNFNPNLMIGDRETAAAVNQCPIEILSLESQHCITLYVPKRPYQYQNV